MGVAAGGNGNKTWLNLPAGIGMRMNSWEWEGMGFKKTFPLISSSQDMLLDVLSTVSDDRIMIDISTTSSCQSAATSKMVKFCWL